MLMLAIETSNPSAHAGAAGVALGEIGAGAPVRVLGREALALGDGAHDDLMPAIARLCARAGVAPTRLGAVAAGLGPGGYTSLRIAVATAKMLCLATGARCAGVPTAEVAARRAAKAHLAGTRFAIALASKHDAAYAQVFVASADGGPPRADGPGRLVTADGVRTLGVEAIHADGFLPAELAAAADAMGLRRVPIELDAAACLEVAAEGAWWVEPEVLVPVYAREPEAVTKWRARHGAPPSA